MDHGQGRDALALRPLHPVLSPRGSVVLSPGRTEPIEKYHEVVGELLDRGFVVFIHDWRGQGLSDRAVKDRLKGHAWGWRPYIDDFQSLLTRFADQLPKPWIALGHSMGGGLTALALAEGEDRFDAAVLTAPMLGLHTPGRSTLMVRYWSHLQCLIGRGQAYVLGRMDDPLAGTFEQNILTHDRDRWTRTQALLKAHPELQLGGISWGWLAFATALCRRLESPAQARRIKTPLLILGAGRDRICKSNAARRLAEQAQNGRYLEVEGAFHEILLETDETRAVFWRAFDGVVADALKGVKAV